MAYDEFGKLIEIVEANMKGYFLSTPFIQYDPDLRPGSMSDIEVKARNDFYSVFRNDDGIRSSRAFDIDIKEFFTLVAVSGSNALLVSSTGEGKTAFARGFLSSIFGEDYAFIQIDPTLSADAVRNINFGRIKSGGTLGDAVIPGPGLTKPAVIIDEIDRAPAAVLNFFQGLFENRDIMLEGNRVITPGIRIKEGVELMDGADTKSSENYQIKIATANIGPEYTGTFTMDKASLDRFPVIVDLDERQMNSLDRSMFAEEKRYNPVPSDSTTAKEARRLLFKLHADAENIKLHPALESFLLYMGNMNNCYVAPEGTKVKIEAFSPQESCQSCPAAATSKSICGNVYAPSNRTIGNLISMVKTFAAFRKFKDPESEEVATIRDLFYVAPFVLAHKLEINREWISKYAHGSTSFAEEEMMHQVYVRWESSMREYAELLEKYTNGGKITSEDSKGLAGALLKNPWLGDQEAMKTIFRSANVVTNGKGAKNLAVN